jgi:NADH:ubiquinone oxidoreductase subunit E
MSPVDGFGISNPNLPVDPAVSEGRVPGRNPQEIPELHEVDCPAELRERIEELMSRYPDRHSASIPALWSVQERYGWCTPDGIRQAAAVMRVTPAYLESVASFYDMLELEPVGRHTIYVCTNLSCQLRGAGEILGAMAEATDAPVGGSSPDGEFHLRSFECLGACDLAPMASVAGHYRGPLTPEDAFTIATQLRDGGSPADVLPEKRLREAQDDHQGGGRLEGGTA